MGADCFSRNTESVRGAEQGSVEEKEEEIWKQKVPLEINEDIRHALERIAWGSAICSLNSIAPRNFQQVFPFLPKCLVSGSVVRKPKSSESWRVESRRDGCPRTA